LKALVTTADGSQFYGIVDSAFGRNHQPWFVPDIGSNWRWRLAIGVKMARLGKSISPKFAPRYYESIGLLWLADADGLAPGEIHCMDGAAVCGEWIPPTEIIKIEGSAIELTINLEQLRLNDLISHISQYMTLKTGDVVALELPISPTACTIDQSIYLSMNGAEVLSFNIK
jgi:hypothetical protein